MIVEREEKLRKSRQEFNTVLDGMNEGVLVLGAKGQVLSINHAAAELLQLEDSALDKNVLYITSNSEIQAVVLDALNGAASEKTAGFGAKYYQISGSPVIDTGVVSGAAILLFDVTDKEKNEQIRREFTANVSHELKTPLHTISGYAEMLDKGMVRSEDIPKFLGKICDEAKRMTDLINDIIELSHLDEGMTDIKWEQVDLYSEAKLVISDLEHIAAEKNVSIVFDGETSLAETIPRLFKEVVHNLVDNAIKYNIPQGHVHVNVTPSEDNITLKVEDTGIGIPEEDMDRIYERFYRVNKSRSRESGGTGLGLSIVKHALQVLNAKIEMSSILNQGTVVCVKINKEKISID